MTQTMVETKVLQEAVELACHAPSLHNSQPWRWVASGSTVDLYADPRRMVASADKSGREAVISCGVVLDHFREVMASIGWDTMIDQFPNPSDRDHLASIHFAPVEGVTDAQRDRAAAIPRRRTDRRSFRAPANWESFEPVLRSTFQDHLAVLDVLADDLRPRLVRASRLVEALRRYDDDYHRELHWWTAPAREIEGIPERALPDEVRGGCGVDVNRRFPAGAHTQDSSRPPDQAKILVLSTLGDTRSDALDCGQALSAVLLECTMAGLATCTVTHITELAPGREILRSLINKRALVPQVLIRVGTAPVGEDAPDPTPRRPLRDVLELHQSN